jgi:hypothetical protein
VISRTVGLDSVPRKSRFMLSKCEGSILSKECHGSGVSECLSSMSYHLERPLYVSNQSICLFPKSSIIAAGSRYSAKGLHEYIWR